MRRKVLMSIRNGAAAALLLLSATWVRSADPVPIKFPADTAPAAAAQKLSKGQFYVIASRRPLLILPVGAGSVTVSARKGPLMLPAELAVGWTPDPGDPEFVTFTDDFLYVVKAGTSGQVDLQVVPALNQTGADGKQVPLKASDVIVKKITVDSGTGPQPPPVPTTSFRVILVYESSQVLPQAQFGVLYGKVVEDFMTARCTGGRAGWARRDKDADGSGDTTAIKSVWAAAKPKITQTPCVAVEVDGSVTVHPIPSSAAETVELLKKLAGDK